MAQQSTMTTPQPSQQPTRLSSNPTGANTLECGDSTLILTINMQSLRQSMSSLISQAHAKPFFGTTHQQDSHQKKHLLTPSATEITQGMVQANVGQKLLKRNKIKSFNQCPKLSCGQCPNEYKRITRTTPPYVILIINPPNKLYTHLS
jgi:hypothetical protein